MFEFGLSSLGTPLFTGLVINDLAMESNQRDMEMHLAQIIHSKNAELNDSFNSEREKRVH